MIFSWSKTNDDEKRRRRLREDEDLQCDILPWRATALLCLYILK